MNTHMIIEMVGYIGSILVVVSMLMTSVMKLRIINTIGSTIFAIYALIIQSYPTAFMNFALVIINLYNMKKLSKGSNNYHMVESLSTDTFINHFLKSYMDDIHQYFPHFSGAEEEEKICLICCGDTPAGILIGKVTADGIMDISLDYTTPMYRDCSVGAYLYGKLKQNGIKKLIFAGGTANHEAYLKKMNFVKENNVYTKRL